MLFNITKYLILSKIFYFSSEWNKARDAVPSYFLVYPSTISSTLCCVELGMQYYKLKYFNMIGRFSWVKDTSCCFKQMPSN